MHSIRVNLGMANRLVQFNEVFEGTKNGFISLIQENLPIEMNGRFSYGPIYGGQMVTNEFGENVLSFWKGGSWNFSTLDKELFFMVLNGLTRREEFAFGMRTGPAEKVNNNFRNGLNYVSCNPGIVLRSYLPEGGVDHLTLAKNGDDFLDALEKHTIEKVRAIDPSLSTDIEFDVVDGEIYKKKNALIDGSFNIFNDGVFSIKADKKVMDLLACIGIGDMSYLGFGHVIPISEPQGKRWNANRRLRANEVMVNGDEYVYPEGPSGGRNSDDNWQ